MNDDDPNAVKSRTGSSIVIGCVVALVLYVLSPGPVASTVNRVWGSSSAVPPAVDRAFDFFYAPLIVAWVNAPQPVYDAYEKYLALWVK